jgi:hypothetical protein
MTNLNREFRRNFSCQETLYSFHDISGGRDTMSDERNKENPVNAANDTSGHRQNSYVGLRAALRYAVSSCNRDRVGCFLSAALVLAIVIALSTTILLIALPKENEHFTDFFILGANRMADDYPDEIIAGQNYPMFIGVGNHEKRNATYIIETWIMNTTFDPATNTTQIITMDPQDRSSFTLADDETTVIPYTLSVGKTDYNRVAFLLFTDTIPGSVLTGGTDRINASYRNLYLHVSVR